MVAFALFGADLILTLILGFLFFIMGYCLWGVMDWFDKRFFK